MSTYMERTRYWLDRANKALLEGEDALHVTPEEFEEMEGLYNQILAERVKQGLMEPGDFREFSRKGSTIITYSGVIEIVVDEDEEKEVPFNWEDEVSDG